MKLYVLLLLALFGQAASAATNSPTTVFNVMEYGAVGDGHTKTTAALQKTIAACAAAGGGTVWFPAGKYLTGALMMESNLTLHLDAGAELLYSGDPADSPIVAARWECTNV